MRQLKFTALMSRASVTASVLFLTACGQSQRTTVDNAATAPPAVTPSDLADSAATPLGTRPDPQSTGDDALSGANPGRRAYVQGMTCEQVGVFAQAVADTKRDGETLRGQLSDLRNLLPAGYDEAKRSLGMIIRAIYSSKPLANATPEAVANAYQKSCEVVEQ